MNQPQGTSTYPGYGSTQNPYGWSWPRSDLASPGTDRVIRALWTVVAVFGLITFGISFGSPVPLSWPVTLSILAAVVGAVGLVSGQAEHGWVVVAAAVTGFLDAVTAWTTALHAGWAPIAVMVINALQALAATIALLRQTRIAQTAKSGAEADYRAYVNMLRSYQAYAAHVQQPPPAAAYGAASHATAQAHGAGAGTGHSDAIEEYEALQAKYAQHGVGRTREQRRTATGPQTVRASDHDPGVPGADRAVFDPPGYGGRQITGDGPVESTGQ